MSRAFLSSNEDQRYLTKIPIYLLFVDIGIGYLATGPIYITDLFSYTQDHLMQKYRTKIMQNFPQLTISIPSFFLDHKLFGF